MEPNRLRVNIFFRKFFVRKVRWVSVLQTPWLPLEVPTVKLVSTVLKNVKDRDQYRGIWARFSANGPLKLTFTNITARSLDMC